MRVTTKMMNDQAVQHMDENLQRLNALNERVSTGKAFQRVSDSPSLATAALSLRSSLAANAAQLETTKSTESWMAATDFSLQQMIKVAKRAFNLTQESLSDTQGPQELKAFAAEMDMLLQQGLDVANTSHQGNFLFAGFKTQPTAAAPTPYQGVDSNGDGKYDSVTYAGDRNGIKRSIGPGEGVTQNVVETNGGTPQPLFQPLLDAMLTAREHLQANDRGALQIDLQSLESALQHVTEAITTNGARQKQVRAFAEQFEKNNIELKSLLSKKEDVNMTEAISSLRYQETVYQAALEIGQRTLSATNLFDLMR
jgi:flagellar hook-associated protein 3 FlgL